MKPLLQHLATRLADKQAINTILDGCAVQVLDSVVWYDTNVLRNCSSVVWEVKYLKMRLLLVHYPLMYNLVLLKEHDEKTAEPGTQSTS